MSAYQQYQTVVLWPWWTQPWVPLMLQMFRTCTNVCWFSGFTTKNCIHWCSVFLGWVVWKIWTSEIKRPMFSSQLCHLQAWSRSLTHSEFLPHSKHPRNIIFPFQIVPVISLCTPDHMSWLSEGNQVYLFLSFSHAHLIFLSPASQIQVSSGTCGIWLGPLCLLTILGWHRPLVLPQCPSHSSPLQTTPLSSEPVQKCPGRQSFGASRPVDFCSYNKAQTSGEGGSGLPVGATQPLRQWTKFFKILECNWKEKT